MRDVLDAEDDCGAMLFDAEGMVKLVAGNAEVTDAERNAKLVICWSSGFVGARLAFPDSWVGLKLSMGTAEDDPTFALTGG